MKAQARILLAALAMLLCLPAAAQQAQARKIKGEPWTLLGPRVGVTWAMTGISQFDQEFQALYSAERSYFSLYSSLGLSWPASAPAPSGFRLMIQGRALLSGLDQNYALPSVTCWSACTSASGWRPSLGPELTFPPDGGSAACPDLRPGMAFSFKEASVPVLLVLSRFRTTGWPAHPAVRHRLRAAAEIPGRRRLQLLASCRWGCRGALLLHCSTWPSANGQGLACPGLMTTPLGLGG